MHLYHGTSLEIARIIRKEGFKVSYIPQYWSVM